jgi:hypothetical protein
VAVSGDGKVYVTSDDLGVNVFTTSGTPLNTFGYMEFEEVDDVAVDTSGNVYVTDRSHYQVPIRKYTGDGVFLTAWGETYDWTVGVAVDASGNVYAARAYAGVIVKYTDDGAYLTEWGAVAGRVAVDGSGSVYVSNSSNHCIQKFTSDGVYVTQWGTYGSGDGQFRYPEGVAVDVSGNVYVADTENYRIQVFAYPTGTDVAPDAPLTLTLDPVSPNPSRGGFLTVHFSLPTTAPARLELLDVAGRRIATHEVGLFGAGPHALDLGKGQHLAPGLYLVRLAQGANVRVTRAVVLK